MEIKFIARVKFINEGRHTHKVRLILPASFIGKRVSMVAQGCYLAFEVAEDGNMCCEYNQGRFGFVMFSCKDTKHIDRGFLGQEYKKEVTCLNGYFSIDVTPVLLPERAPSKAIEPRKFVQVVASSREDALKAIKTLNDYAKANGYDFVVTDGKVSLSRSDVLAA